MLGCQGNNAERQSQKDGEIEMRESERKMCRVGLSHPADFLSYCTGLLQPPH